MTAEATLRAAVLKRITEDYPRRTSGVLIFGRPAGAATGPGHPDLFGVVVGRFIALEIKIRGSQPTPLQVQRLLDLRAAGACAWVIRTTLEASKAIYQVKQGARTLTDQPIDFDDWFKEITSTPVANTATASIAETAEPSTEADSAALDDLLNLDAEAAAQPEPEPVKPRRRRKAAAAAEPVAEAPALEPTPFDDIELPAADGEGVPYDKAALRPSIQEQADADQRIAYLIEVMKAVGDRVTLVYEQGNRIEAKLDKLIADFDALLEEDL